MGSDEDIEVHLQMNLDGKRLKLTVMQPCGQAGDREYMVNVDRNDAGR